MSVILTEEHRIRCRHRDALYRRIDDFCYQVKNLHNSTNYLIRQSARISRKLKEEKPLEDWEEQLLREVNAAITRYGTGRKTALHPIDADHSFLADAYFLSWYRKDTENYRAVPYATCSQICIQELCRAWKSFYRGLQAYNRAPGAMTGRPHAPGYLDPAKGRGQLVLTSQNFRILPDGTLLLPSFLKGIRIRPAHSGIRQLRIVTTEDSILVQLMYEAEELPLTEDTGIMGIDLGVSNLMAVTTDGKEEPVLISGKPLKSMNQYYNKKKARLQELSRKSNGLFTTEKLRKLGARRNRKVKDYLHKASRKVIRLARERHIGLIVIGNNKGWKQAVSLGKKTNQNFVSIPFATLIDMIRYKAALAGIRVEVVSEQYTSGTSCLDGEMPEKRYYNKSRRISRGLLIRAWA